MTDRGHGAMGLVDNLRTFADLIDDSGASRRPYLEFFPGAALTTNWTLNSGVTWQYNGLLNFSFSGVLLDVVGIETSLGALTRAETLADCIATAGTFYSVAAFGAPAATLPRWDDGTLWDAGGVTWDHATYIDLYVHLSDGSSPNAATLVPLLGLFFGTKGEVHPQLGPEKLTNGGFESLTGWSERVSPGWDDGITLWDAVGVTWDSSPVSTLDSVLFYGRGSVSSLKLVSTGSATGFGGRYQDLPTVAGVSYRLAAYYRTDPAFSANLSARLLVSNTTATTILYSDGRDGDSVGFVALTPTGGEWRRCLFDFIAPASTTRVQLQLYAGTAGAGQLNFDGVTLKRIYRFAYYEPRLAVESIPEVEVGSQSIFFAGKTDGQGNVSLINADGTLEDLLAQLLLAGKPMTVYVGGHFASDGREVYRDDWRGAWPGRAQTMECTDEMIAFECDDARDALHVQLPTRVHSLADEPSLNLNDEGSGRVIVFDGAATNANKPARVDLTGSGYGVYEIGDGSASLAGFPDAIADYTGPSGSARQIPNLWVYPNEEMADKDVFGFTLAAISQAIAFQWYVGGPTVQPFWSYDKALGRITVLDDIRNYTRERDGTSADASLIFDFSIGGGALSAVIPPGIVVGAGGSLYYLSANMLAASLQERMRTASGAADIFVDYSHTTHLWTVRKTAGTLSLLTSTGSSSKLRAWEKLGFDPSTDKTGALTYTGSTATFTSPEADHIVRVVSFGFKDDAAGTITGTPSAVISKHADVAEYILRQYLKVPASQIDAASFTAGAAAETTALVGVALKEQMASSEFLTRLEAGAIADLRIDGDGLWSWKPYSASTPVSQDFFDRDFLSFSIKRDPSNVFSSVRVTYGQNPGRDSEKKYEYVADSAIPTKHRRLEVLPIETWIGASTAQDAAAQLLGQRMARLAAANPRVVTFTARGKLVDVLQGDIIRLTRARAFDSTGALAAVRFRVLGLRHNHIAGTSECSAVEDVQFLT
jgi:hypothetical protein